MEAKSSADKAKQILVEAPLLQEKKRRGRQPAAKTNEKECRAANKLENHSLDHTGYLQKTRINFIKHNMTNTPRFCISNFLLKNYRNGGRILSWPGKANQIGRAHV